MEQQRRPWEQVAELAFVMVCFVLFFVCLKTVNKLENFSVISCMDAEFIGNKCTVYSF